MMEKLKLCKCGDEPTRYRFKKNSRWRYYFGCIGCNFYGRDAGTEEQAGKNWNTRTELEGGDRG